MKGDTMKRTITWIAWLATGLVAALVALNWPAMIATAPLNMVAIEVQWPLGLVISASLPCP